MTKYWRRKGGMNVHTGGCGLQLSITTYWCSTNGMVLCVLQTGHLFPTVALIYSQTWLMQPPLVTTHIDHIEQVLITSKLIQMWVGCCRTCEGVYTCFTMRYIGHCIAIPYSDILIKLLYSFRLVPLVLVQ